MRPKNPWSNTHLTLKRLWDERIAPTGMSQEEFGEQFGIGTQGMVSQYLLGTRPLNYDAAAKFARGFECSIEDICPEMARTLSKDILPVLRRRLRRRAAMFAVASLIPGLVAPSPSDASVLQVAVQAIESGLRIMSNWILALFAMRTSDCKHSVSFAPGL